MRYILTFLAAMGVVFITMALLTETAKAQVGPACDDRNAMVATLANKYQEVQIGIGIGSDELLYEFWVNVDTGTWTILMTHPNGVACVARVGEDYVPGSVMGNPA